MSKRCIVPTCMNTRYSYPRMPLFSLPTDSYRRDLWLNSIRINEDDVGANPAVCLVHFEKQYIIDYGFRKNLRHNAVPLLLLGEETTMGNHERSPNQPKDEPVDPSEPADSSNPPAAAIDDTNHRDQHQQQSINTTITFDNAPPIVPPAMMRAAATPDGLFLTRGGNQVKIRDPSTPYCKLRRLVHIGQPEQNNNGYQQQGDRTVTGGENGGYRTQLYELRAATGSSSSSSSSALSTFRQLGKRKDLTQDWFCEYCMGTFVSRKGLSTHQIRLHYLDNGLIRYYCSICTKVKVNYFADEDEYNYHLINIHRIDLGKTIITKNEEKRLRLGGGGESTATAKATTSNPVVIQCDSSTNGYVPSFKGDDEDAETTGCESGIEMCASSNDETYHHREDSGKKKNRRRNGGAKRSRNVSIDHPDIVDQESSSRNNDEVLAAWTSEAGLKRECEISDDDVEVERTSEVIAIKSELIS